MVPREARNLSHFYVLMRPVLEGPGLVRLRLPVVRFACAACARPGPAPRLARLGGSALGSARLRRALGRVRRVRLRSARGSGRARACCWHLHACRTRFARPSRAADEPSPSRGPSPAGACRRIAARRRCRGRGDCLALLGLAVAVAVAAPS